MKPRLCTFIKPDDLPCQAFALTGSALCHAHKRQQARQRRRYKALRPPAIRLGPLADQRSIQRAIGRILCSIAANSLPLERSSALLQKVLRAIEKRNHAAAVAASAGSFNLPAFALTPARLYNQPNPAQKDIPRSRQPERKI
jgi:hypothetical protein